MPHGYKLVSKVKSADPNFIPSLIAIHRSHTSPSPDDSYFESIDLIGYKPGCVEMIERTSLVAYDSMELGFRDPILKVYTSKMNFYTTVSEAYRLAADEDDELLQRILDAITGNKRDAS